MQEIDLQGESLSDGSPNPKYQAEFLLDQAAKLLEIRNMDQSRADLSASLSKVLRNNDVAAATGHKGDKHKKQRKDKKESRGGKRDRKDRKGKSNKCKFYQRGDCHNGDDCPFEHVRERGERGRNRGNPHAMAGPVDSAPAPAGSSGDKVDYDFKSWDNGNKPCFAFSTGQCRRGADCKYKHRDLVPWEEHFREHNYNKPKGGGKGGSSKGSKKHSAPAPHRGGHRKYHHSRSGSGSSSYSSRGRSTSRTSSSKSRNFHSRSSGRRSSSGSGRSYHGHSGKGDRGGRRGNYSRRSHSRGRDGGKCQPSRERRQHSRGGGGGHRRRNGSRNGRHAAPATIVNQAPSQLVEVRPSTNPISPPPEPVSSDHDGSATSADVSRH